MRLPDHSLPFILYTDWNSNGLGVILAQVSSDGEEYVVAYASRSNNRAESNYSSYHGELLAAIWAIQHFQPYLYGRHFTLITDHQPLTWLLSNDELTCKLAHWSLILQEYDFVVVYRAGVAHEKR